MTSINDVRLVGRLTKSPEFQETGAGKKFARLSVETENFIRVNGERRRIAHVHTVVCYNQFSLPVLAEVGTGARVKVLGELSYDRAGKAEVRVMQYSGEVGLMDPLVAGGEASEPQAQVVAEPKSQARPSGGLGKLPQSRTVHDSAPEPRRESFTSDSEDDEIPF